MGGRPRQPRKQMKTRSKLLSILSCVMLATSLLMTEAYALEIPVSQVEQMIDGRQTITQVFEVSPDVAPESLIQEEIIQHGYRFTMTSITKEAVLVEDEKEITQEQSVVVNVSDADKARLEALLSMPAFIEYDEEGYVGKLYPVVSSLSGRETGRTSHSGYNTVTKSYTFDYNDDSLVPTSNGGYALSNISWSEGEYMDDSGIPENYVATATYRKGYSYSTVDGWEYTMSYVGDVTFKREDTIKYTLVYTGEVIEEPGFWESLFGGKDDSTNMGPTGTNPNAGPTGTNPNGTPTDGTSSSSHSFPWGAVAGIFFIIVAIGAAGFGIYTLVCVLRDNRIDVYAEDPVSGEYTQMKSVWFKSKDSSITIDTLAAPAAQNFRVTLKPRLAAKLKGKVVTLRAGQNMIKHSIGDAGGTEYTMSIDVIP